MIKYNDKDIESINFGKTAITQIYCGKILVWESLSGCFTKGYWINNKKWTNDKSWKNE